MVKKIVLTLVLSISSFMICGYYKVKIFYWLTRPVESLTYSMTQGNPDQMLASGFLLFAAYWTVLWFILIILVSKIISLKKSLENRRA